MPVHAAHVTSTTGPSSIRSARRNPGQPPSSTGAAQSELQELLREATAQDVAHEKEMEKLDAEMLKQDTTGWWTRTGWQAHFQGRNLRRIADTSRLPDQDEEIL